MSLLSQIIDALSAAITQDQRLLKLHTPLGANVLLAERVEIDEGIAPVGAAGEALDGAPAAGTRVVVQALSTDAHLELKTLIGQPALVELLTQQSRTALRPWHGHITRAELLGSDGGLARYRLTIEPWLAFLGHTQDAWVFQNQSVQGIVEEIFADYAGQGRLAPAWRWELADASVYPLRSLCIQYHESDLDFVQRLLREEGLFYWFEHQGDPDAAGLGSHTLVIADHNGAFEASSQPLVRYTHSHAVMKEDSITQWQRSAHVRSAGLALASPDHRSMSLRAVSQIGVRAPADLTPDSLLLSDVPGAYAYEDSTQGERLALRQMQAIDALREQVSANCTVRVTAPARTFTLLDHPVHDGSDSDRDQFVVLRAHHRARNNLSADHKAHLETLLGAIARDQREKPPQNANQTDEPLYSCELIAQRAAVPVRVTEFNLHGQPDPRIHPRPTVYGVQSALVVGLDAPVHTDRDHRIKIQFHWQRGANASHRLDHEGGSNAPASDASGTWVRVSQTVAGDNWGMNFVPRLGQEVLVAFIEGDIDRPVVIGSAYNGQGQPDAQANSVAAGAALATGNAAPWFPGSEAAGSLQGHRHPAVHAGFKSQELATSQSGGGGYNQLVLDDSPGASRIELSSSSAATRLQLGHLLQQDDNQRMNLRGHGVDLATGAWGAVRAGSGLLISAHGQPGSESASRQMESREPQNGLEQARQLITTLAESAQKQNAKTTDEPAPDKLKVATAIDGKLKSLRTTDTRNALVAEDAAPQAEAPAAKATTPAFDEQIRFVNALGTPLTHVAYTLQLGDGSQVKGRTDAHGKTQRIKTATPQAITHATLTSRPLQSCCLAHPEPSEPDLLHFGLETHGVQTNPVDVGGSVKDVPTPKDAARPLTAGEIAMARLVFGSSINYSTVKVHNGEYLWFGLQKDDIAMTPNGELYFNSKNFSEDFSAEVPATRRWFMHEMTHVWQYQLGYPVKIRGALRIGLSYDYELGGGRQLSSYDMEAQGEIVADYFALKHLHAPNILRERRYATQLALYEQQALLLFLANPASKLNLPGGSEPARDDWH